MAAVPPWMTPVAETYSSQHTSHSLAVHKSRHLARKHDAPSPKKRRPHVAAAAPPPLAAREDELASFGTTDADTSDSNDDSRHAGSRYLAHRSHSLDPNSSPQRFRSQRATDSGSNNSSHHAGDRFRTERFADSGSNDSSHHKGDRSRSIRMAEPGATDFHGSRHLARDADATRFRTIQRSDLESDGSVSGGSRFTSKESSLHAGNRFPRGAERAPSSASTCVDPDHIELIRSVSAVLVRRMHDNEEAEERLRMPLFNEDTHTVKPASDRWRVEVPSLYVPALPLATLYHLELLPPPELPPPLFPVPDEDDVSAFIEHIWFKTKLTPQSLVICLIYIDRLESKSTSVVLHARSWRPIVFSALLLASKVWHDVSYWNSDFSNICPMFTTRNVNQMERAFLQLLTYNTIITASQYASYYFSLRAASRSRALQRGEAAERAGGGRNEAIPVVEATAASLAEGGAAQNTRIKHHASDSFNERREGPFSKPSADENFRSKYFMSLNISGAARLEAPQRLSLQ